MRQGLAEEAETQLRAAIHCARAQGTKSRELHSSVTLATLLAERGDPKAAHNHLSPICAGFTEGADTKDLLEARALLQELAS